MKTKNDFTTNSSSSSFIVGKDKLESKELLYKALVEIHLAFTGNDFDEDYCAVNVAEQLFYIEDKEPRKEPIPEREPWEDRYDYDDYKNRNYDNCFIIGNDVYCGIFNKGYYGCRFDFDKVKKVMEKYGIEWHYGYGD